MPSLVLKSCNIVSFKASIIVSSVCLSRLNETEVVVGEHKYREENPKRRYFNVSQFIVHDKFRLSPNGSVDYDLALLQLDTDIVMSDEVRPICAPNPEKRYGHRRSILAGWGYTEGKIPNHIRNVSL